MPATRSANLCAVSRRAASPSAATGLETQQIAADTAIEINAHGKSGFFDNNFLQVSPKNCTLAPPLRALPVPPQ
jgi:hypothetical protein